MVTATGRIKRLIMDKSFGFIAPDDRGQELFFHRSAVVGFQFEDLREGDAVTYEPGQGQKGPRAESVTVI